MFSALSLIWDNLIQIGAPQLKAIYEDPNFNEDDAIRSDLYRRVSPYYQCR